MREEEFFDLITLPSSHFLIEHHETDDGREWYDIKRKNDWRKHWYMFSYEDGSWRILNTYITQPSGAADPYDTVLRFGYAYEFDTFEDLLESMDRFLFNEGENYGYDVSGDYEEAEDYYYSHGGK